MKEMGEGDNLSSYKSPGSCPRCLFCPGVDLLKNLVAKEEFGLGFLSLLSGGPAGSSSTWGHTPASHARQWWAWMWRRLYEYQWPGDRSGWSVSGGRMLSGQKRKRKKEIVPQRIKKSTRSNLRYLYFKTRVCWQGWVWGKYGAESLSSNILKTAVWSGN